jgi:hypothetical protein
LVGRWQGNPIEFSDLLLDVRFRDIHIDHRRLDILVPPLPSEWRRDCRPPWPSASRRLGCLGQDPLKLPNLIALIRDRSKGAKHSLCEGGTTVSIRHGQNSLLNLRGETKHTHDLGHPGTGDSLLPGNICLVDDLAGLQENLPLNGLPEELYDPGRPGHLGQFQVSLEGR